ALLGEALHEVEVFRVEVARRGAVQAEGTEGATVYQQREGYQGTIACDGFPACQVRVTGVLLGEGSHHDGLPGPDGVRHRQLRIGGKTGPALRHFRRVAHDAEV